MLFCIFGGLLSLGLAIPTVPHFGSDLQNIFVHNYAGLPMRMYNYNLDKGQKRTYFDLPLTFLPFTVDKLTGNDEYAKAVDLTKK